MYRTHTCGELNHRHIGIQVTLSGWVQRTRDLGGMTFIDLRDRYGITQLVFNMEQQPDLCLQARKLGREFVIQVIGTVTERSNKNPNLPTGDIEITTTQLTVLNPSAVPPFTIEDDTDGGDELRMKYRYLDLRRQINRRNLETRYHIAIETRNYLTRLNFIDIETPFLIKSTPEGARDFVVPSRISQGEFYALPQSPQTFKQILMVAGYDRYYQIVRCFRDEDLRADRQPEFTQIDCEMAFVHRDDILDTFEGLVKHLFKTIKGIEMNGDFPRMSYEEAMNSYGCDKPDLRFGMKIHELTSMVKGKGFQVFDQANYIGGLCVMGCANYSRKQTDELTEFIKRPQIGGTGLITVRITADGSIKSSVDKFFTPDDLKQWSETTGAKPGDLLLVMAGEKEKTLSALSELRLEMGSRLNLRDKNKFIPLWVIDFPLFEWNEDDQRFYAKHHPFTSPRPEDADLFETNPGKMLANAYDLVINGVEIGGGSVRIHDQQMQKRMFKALGFTDEEAQYQFGFLLEAFRYGAPPHAGIAFGFDRFTALFTGNDSIRDVIAFPKNNQGRDMMIDAPCRISEKQLDELKIKIVPAGSK